MFKISVLRAFSILIFLSGVAFAIDYPLNRTITIKIPNNTTTVLEFPFVIKDKRFDRFKKIRIVNAGNVKKSGQKITSLDSVKVPQMTTTSKIINGKKVIIKKKVSKSKKSKKRKSLKVTTSKDGNIMELIPSSLGTTKVVVWGYKYHPVMIHLEVVKNKPDTDDYYKFVDFKTPKSEVVKFETSRHESVIKRLLQHGYWKKAPRGYKEELMDEVEDGKFYKAKLTSVMTGKKYGLKSYVLENTSDETILLTNEMFYIKGHVYSVSIEKLNKELLPNEKTRVFIVFKYKES